MNESASVTSAHMSDSMVYRPLSGLAVAAFGVAVLYAALIVLTGLISWLSRSPSLFPFWTLIVPMTAAGLALAARRQIRLAEGTRSGDFLATWGLRISVSFGLLFLAGYFGTSLAVGLQAQKFAQRWFDYLREDKTFEAFLLTQAPENQQSDNPLDRKRIEIRYGKGEGPKNKSPLGMFLDSEVTRVLRQGGSNMTIESRGVRNWVYDKGYFVNLEYRITTEEGVYDLVMVLMRSDAPESSGWRLVWQEDTPRFEKKKLTPMGETTQVWRSNAQRFTTEWLTKVQLGRLEDPYLATLDPKKREQLVDIAYAQKHLSDLALVASILSDAGPVFPLARVGCSSGSRLSSLCSLPGFANFTTGALVRTEGEEGSASWKMENSSELRQADIVRDVKTLFWMSKPTLQVASADSPMRVIEMTPSRFRVYYPLMITGASSKSSGPLVPWQCEARFVVEHVPGPTPNVQPNSWRIVSLDLLRASKPPEDPNRPSPGRR